MFVYSHYTKIITCVYLQLFCMLLLLHPSPHLNPQFVLLAHRTCLVHSIPFIPTLTQFSLPFPPTSTNTRYSLRPFKEVANT